MLNLTKPFLYQSCKVVAQVMQDAYPELIDSQPYVEQVVQAEEERFSETLDSGLKILQEEVANLKENNKRKLPGELAFKLYDTYGFPLDLTADIVSEEGLTVEEAGFHSAMDAQKKRARKAWKGSGENAIDDSFKQLSASGIASTFLGYEHSETTSPVTALLKDGSEVPSVSAGDEVMIITRETPFYGESGGQVGDTGIIEGTNLLVTIHATLSPLPTLIIHKGVVQKGSLSKGDTVHLQIDGSKRTATALNHTATHLLQAALRDILGDHIKQAGSLVTPDRLRFDFTHYSALERDDLDRIEASVNQRIRENYPVETCTLPYQEAVQSGALALFGEKYSDTVRMITIDTISRELCGGTHTYRTGNIAIFKLLSESSVAAGVRRIEALTGEGALTFIKEEEKTLSALSSLLKAQPEDMIAKTSKLIDECKSLQKEVAALKQSRVSSGAGNLLNQARDVKGVKVIATRVEAENQKTLREYADRIKDQLKSGVIIVGGVGAEKAFLVVVVTKDLAPALHAGKIIQEVAQGIGGSGGGRADMAQAGGKEKDKLEETLEKAYSIIDAMLS